MWTSAFSFAPELLQPFAGRIGLYYCDEMVMANTARRGFRLADREGNKRLYAAARCAARSIER